MSCLSGFLVLLLCSSDSCGVWLCLDLSVLFLLDFLLFSLVFPGAGFSEGHPSIPCESGVLSLPLEPPCFVYAGLLPDPAAAAGDRLDDPLPVSTDADRFSEARGGGGAPLLADITPPAFSPFTPKYCSCNFFSNS